MDKAKKQRFIPMEITTQTDKVFARAHDFTEKDIKLWKIGNRLARVILIPCTEEVYKAFMEPIWNRMKAEERKREYFKENNITETSVEKLQEEYGVDIPVTETDTEDELLLTELKDLLLSLEDLDRQIFTLRWQGYTDAEIGEVIGMSQRGTNKRRKKLRDLEFFGSKKVQ